ncbi:16S rRNA (uracil(1498)-N(3))-methyltransferase [Hahella sp. CR1]|uniref:16S rRNA (uracil(1498)-N(3))-methyltransferase n=1 Tax=Hahella sp. CR1 TaxID=2992807 RepID=UPI002442D89C|nr:16S rRNA (uracil(1498)-N(3))-methyltransferase [Hahella sp. CR1]MDG9669782.1 16S rRNA (uracil(1498)-N(3))-methyltransferase [Hahella sp. CR1]
MRNNRIFIDQPLDGLSQLTLTGDQANYVGRVLRMRPGDAFHLFSGDGRDFPAKVLAVGRRDVEVALSEPLAIDAESSLNVHLGQVVSRGERMDYAVQKATEMGVTALTPLLSERCEVRLDGERQDKRWRHWRQVSISACEQCGRARVPDIGDVTPLESWLQNVTADLKLILHPGDARAWSPAQRPASVCLLIGPEGGFTDEEVALAERHGFVHAPLGPRILRTETAPVAALALMQWLWGDFGDSTPT